MGITCGCGGTSILFKSVNIFQYNLILIVGQYTGNVFSKSERMSDLFAHSQSNQLTLNVKILKLSSNFVKFYKGETYVGSNISNRCFGLVFSKSVINRFSDINCI